MDMKVMRYFTTLARTKNQAKAARELFITPQGLATAIKRLESSMGVPLLDTHTGTVELTEYGEIFYEHAREILREHDAMSDEIQTLFRRRSGRISVAISTGLENIIPHNEIRAFNEGSTTGAQVEISRNVVDFDCENSLYQRTCDFALLNNPIDHTLFLSIPLFKDMMQLVVRNDHPLAGRELLGIEDLAGLTIAHVTPREYRTSRVDEQKIFAEVDDVTFLHMNEMIGVLECVMKGAAAGLMPRPHSQLFGAERLVGIPVKQLEWGFGVAYRSDRVLTPQDQEFLDFLRQYQQFYC